MSSLGRSRCGLVPNKLDWRNGYLSCELLSLMGVDTRPCLGHGCFSKCTCAAL